MYLMDDMVGGVSKRGGELKSVVALPFKRSHSDTWTSEGCQHKDAALSRV